jgi:hypothetical protein
MRPSLGLVVILVLTGVACDDGGNDPAEPTTTTTAAPTSTTQATTATTAGRTATSVPPYGSACEAGSHPDCIDPDGDGRYEYLQGGAQCLENLGDSGLCSDLDGDGVAGYPDPG